MKKKTSPLLCPSAWAHKRIVTEVGLNVVKFGFCSSYIVWFLDEQSETSILFLRFPQALEVNQPAVLSNHGRKWFSSWRAMCRWLYSDREN